MIRRVIVILVMLALLPIYAAAAQILNQTHVSEDGSFSFRYPEGATVSDYGSGSVYVDYYGATDDPNDYLFVGIDNYSYTEFGISEGHNALQALRAQVQEQAKTDTSILSVQDINVGRFAALRVDYEFGATITIPDQITQSILLIFAYGDLTRYERMLLDMAGSVNFGTGLQASGSGGFAPATPEPVIVEPSEVIPVDAQVIPSNGVVVTFPLDAKVSIGDFEELTVTLPDDLELHIAVQSPEQIGTDDILGYVRDEFGSLPQLINWTEITVGDYPAFQVNTTPDAPYPTDLTYFINVEDTRLVIFDVFGDIATHADTYNAIADSIALSDTLVVVPEGTDADGVPLPDRLGLKWQVQLPTGDEGETYGYFNDLDMGDDGLIYIAGGSVGIHIFDPIAGEFRGVIRNAEVSSFSDVAADPDGSFWVVDGLARRVYHLDSAGSLLDQWGEIGQAAGQFEMPTQIEVAPDGRLYIFDTNTDPDGFRYGHVMVFQSDGTFDFDFKTRVDVREEFEAYNGSGVKMTFAPDGHLYMVNRFDAVRVFDLEGKVIHFELEPSLRNVAASAITADNNGVIYIANSTNGLIQKIDPDNPQLSDRFGRKQANLTGGGYSSDYDRGEIFAPQGLAVLPNGDVIAADSNLGYSQLIRFTFDEPREE